MCSLFAKSSLTLKKGFTISDEEFTNLRDLVYAQLGIFVDDRKKYLFENRFSTRLTELGLKSFGEYYKYLKHDIRRKQEWDHFVELITTNETSFFRDLPQLKAFQKEVLPLVLDAQRKAGKKELAIWCAGCSSGEEPYTLSMILHETLGMEIKSWRIRITANDISMDMLKTARAGLYKKYALRTTPKAIIDKYFTPENDLFKIRPEIGRLINFGRINLNDAAAIKRVPKSHIVFCRNVIIYFDKEMKKKVIGGFYDNLHPDGKLFVGHSESLHAITRAFKPVHHTGAISYMKL